MQQTENLDLPEPHELKQGRRFDEFAAKYDQTPDQYPIRGVVRDKAGEIIRSLGARTVLDAGCGTGSLLIGLADTITRGLGVDISLQMIEVARRKSASAGKDNIHFQFASLLDLSLQFLEQQSFRSVETIVSTYAMHHLPNTEKKRLVERFATMLAPSGSLVIGDLIFSADPAEHKPDFSLVGYDPETDDPETFESLNQMLVDAGLATKYVDIHPLAGVLVGTKAIEPPR